MELEAEVKLFEKQKALLERQSLHCRKNTFLRYDDRAGGE